MKKFHRHALLLVAAGLVACGGPAVSIATSPSPSGRVGAFSGNASVVPAHLWVQLGQPPSGSIAVLDTGAHRSGTPFPYGVPTRDWSHVYAVTGAGSATVIDDIEATTGRTVASTPTDAGYALASLGPSSRAMGLSPNGLHLVLTGNPTASYPAQSATSRFLVYEAKQLNRAPLRVTLPGAFAYDGISDDGRNLYLLEDLNPAAAGGGYHVRRYDLAAGALDPAVIVDKRTGERTMSGDPTDTVTSADGAWQYTVYAFGPEHPFVHALNLNDATSFCIDLPKAPLDEAMDLLWGLAASHDGRFVYAINTGNGVVFQLPAGRPWQARQASLPVPTPVSTEAFLPFGPVTAEAKRIAYGAAAISADDRTLYSIGDLGIFVVDTATLTLTGSFVPTQPLTSLVMSSDGRQLYAVSVDSVTPLLQVDVRDGHWAPVPGVSRPLSVLRAVA